MLSGNKTLLEASRYLIVGAICTALDIAIMYGLVHFAAVDYLAASVFSFMAGAVLNYFLCTAWIFEFRRVQRRHQEFAYYLLISAAALAVNTGLMWCLTSGAGFHFLASKGLAIIATFALNFLLRKYLLHTA